MNDLLTAIKGLDRSTRDLHARFFPDNPPSLDVRLAVWGEELWEYGEAYAEWVGSDTSEVCKECADLVVTTLGLMHWKGVLSDTLFTEIQCYLDIGKNANEVYIRSVYKKAPMLLAYLIHGNDLEVIGLGAEFISLVVKAIVFSLNVPRDVIDGMQAVITKNDAKTVANGYGINAAGKIARVS